MDNILKEIIQEILDTEHVVVVDSWSSVSHKACLKLRKYMAEVYKQDMENKRVNELMDLRDAKAQEIFEVDPLDGLECVDADNGWEVDEDQYIKKFYFEQEGATSESGVATFIVKFKKDSDEVEDKYINAW
jgi:hypothetical protein